MNRPELYKKTVDILYEAYFRNDLRHRHCCACAVGNIIAANMDFRINSDLDWVARNGNEIDPEWYHVFCTLADGEGENETFWQNKNSHEYRCNLAAKREIDSTGYNYEELAAIELDFETAKKGRTDEDYMFNGLVAVLEVLKQIHEVEDNEPEVIRFKNHYNTKCQVQP